MLDYSISLLRRSHRVILSSVRYQRTPFGKPKRTFEDCNRVVLSAHLDKRLRLAEPVEKPYQWRAPQQSPDPLIVRKERRLPSLVEAASPYQNYSPEQIKAAQDLGTYFDPLFNPHLHEQRNAVDPEEEPFNAIYASSKSEGAKEYTSVRNITSPELWAYVERLARIRIAPQPKRRKLGEPVVALPSGYVPPPENPPDLPYFIARTRNYLLPVYYYLHSEPEKCTTMVKMVTGDLWQLEEDLRTHLEKVTQSKDPIMSSVQETDARVLFRGRYVHEVVEWLHSKGF